MLAGTYAKWAYEVRADETMTKPLPDILTSVQFWASIATVWAAAAANFFWSEESVPRAKFFTLGE